MPTMSLPAPPPADATLARSVAWKRWYLEGVLSLFRGLKPEDLSWLEGQLSHRRVPRGTLLPLGGADGQVYFLKGGVVRLWVLGPDGRELSLQYLKAGASFGALDGGEPSEEATGEGAEVVEEALICQMDAQAFAAFAQRCPELSWRVSKLLGWRLKRLQVRLHQLLFLGLAERLLVVLRDLAEEHGEAHPLGRSIPLRLTHKDLARLAGATRESSTVALAQLVKQGQVAWEGKRIVLLEDRDGKAAY